MLSKRADMRQQLNQAVERRSCSSPRMVMNMVRLSAHVGNADLRKGNDFLRSRTSAALGVVREGAVHRLLGTCTQTARGRAQVKTRP